MTRILPLFVIVALAGCTPEPTGSGDGTVQSVDAYRAVESRGDAKIHFVASADDEIRSVCRLGVYSVASVTADETLILTAGEGCEVYVDASRTESLVIVGNGDVVIDDDVDFAMLANVDLRGSGDVTLRGSHTGAVKVDAKGSGTLVWTQSRAQTLAVDAKGSSDVIVAGAPAHVGTMLTADVGGSAHLDASGWMTEDADLALAGTARAEIAASGSVEAVVDGTSALVVDGTIDVVTSGTGAVAYTGELGAYTAIENRSGGDLVLTDDLGAGEVAVVCHSGASVTAGLAAGALRLTGEGAQDCVVSAQSAGITAIEATGQGAVTTEAGVALETLDEVTLGGGGVVTLGAVTTDRLDIGAALDATGSVTIEDLDADELVLVLAGEADVTVSGTAVALDVLSTSGGDLMAGALLVGDADVVLSGSGDATLQVTGNVTAVVSHAGAVLTVAGTVDVDGVTSNGGSIVLTDL